jgi:hypothetical protein
MKGFGGRPKLVWGNASFTIRIFKVGKYHEL